MIYRWISIKNSALYRLCILYSVTDIKPSLQAPLFTYTCSLFISTSKVCVKEINLVAVRFSFFHTHLSSTNIHTLMNRTQSERPLFKYIQIQFPTSSRCLTVLVSRWNTPTNSLPTELVSMTDHALHINYLFPLILTNKWNMYGNVLGRQAAFYHTFWSTIANFTK